MSTRPKSISGRYATINAWIRQAGGLDNEGFELRWSDYIAQHGRSQLDARLDYIRDSSGGP